MCRQHEFLTIQAGLRLWEGCSPSEKWPLPQATGPVCFLGLCHLYAEPSSTPPDQVTFQKLPLHTLPRVTRNPWCSQSQRSSLSHCLPCWRETGSVSTGLVLLLAQHSGQFTMPRQKPGLSKNLRASCKRSGPSQPNQEVPMPHGDSGVVPLE